MSNDNEKGNDVFLTTIGVLEQRTKRGDIVKDLKTRQMVYVSKDYTKSTLRRGQSVPLSLQVNPFDWNYYWVETS